MSRGPNGEHRPADTVGCAVTVARIATGELEETPPRPGKRRGGLAQAEKLSSAERSKIARMGAKARWGER